MTIEQELRRLSGCLALSTLECGAGVAAVSPQLQGRVLTSGLPGLPGFGWVNHGLVESGRKMPHIHAYGGEDRLWVGPEGGQFSVFFPPGAPFEFESWQTPEAIDAEPWELAGADSAEVRLAKPARFMNWSGNEFEVRFDRTVRAVPHHEVALTLGVEPPAGRWLAFESVNRAENTGQRPWTQETGLLSLWVLGMFQPGPQTVVGIPLAGPAPVNDRYFGQVPPGRLAVEEDCAFFLGDGQCRSKVGVGPAGATPRLCSWDAGRELLTVAEFDLSPAPHGYVNSLWEPQAEPYAGDVVNSYNDGPPSPGQPPLGPFYELETSSPALALGPGESAAHRHRTVHVLGPEGALVFERLCGRSPLSALALLQAGTGA